MACLLTDFVKPCVEKLIDKLIDGAIGELRYVCCFTSIVKEFEEELPTLKAEKSTMEQRIDVETRNGNNIAPNAQQWIEEVDKLIQENIETKNKCFFGFCPDCVRQYKRGKELANKKEKTKRLVEDGKNLLNIGIPRPLLDVGFHSSQNYISFKGRESKYAELLETLKDENNFITGLYGMGGAGKTTLAREVGKQLKESKIFDLVIDTTVSSAPNIKKIQDEFAGLLGLKWEDCPESLRHRKLRDRLTIVGQKILVILDDVWEQNPIDFDAIGIPKQDNHNGCRLLVTTRTKRVLNKMGCHEIIELEVLSKEDSRIMFQSYAGLTNNSPKSLIDKGHKIADECKGLPVAIAAVAGSLKRQESPEEWDVALKSLQNPLSSSIQGDDDKSLAKIYNCLKVSYDYLKDENVQGLFLLCSVFPEDEEISVEILTRLGVGAGLFGEDYNTYNDARNQLVAAKNKLLDSSLLLEAGKGRVKMHDLVREVAQWIANQEKNTKYLFWEGKVREMFSSSFGGSKLEILIASFNTDGDGDCVEVPNSFFENMAGLRVLHLDHKRSSYAELAFSLPGSIQSLMNIRSLLVSRVDLGDISVLGNLQCLETLDLDSCKITELPNEITKLEKFKLLKLEGCEIKRNNPFEVIGKCSFLQELHFKNSFNDFCKKVNDFPTLLKRYVISTKGDVRFSEPKCVVLWNVNLDTFSEATLKYFFQTTEALEVDGIKWRWKNLIPEIVPVDQGMNDLVHLHLSYISELQYLIKTIDSRVPNVFSKLVVLKLKFIENLEELCNGPLSSDSLKALEKLSISSCKKLRSLFNCNLDLCNLKRMTIMECPLLVSLFQLSTAKSLMMLEELKIHACEQLESIITDEKGVEESVEEILVNDGDNDNKKHSSMFPKLKFLNIRRCPKLELVLPFLSGDLPLLETISIKRCDKLKYIFDQFVKFGALKFVELRELSNFIGIFPESGHLMPQFAKGSSSSLRDGFKAQTQLDPIKCNVFSWTQRCCYGLKYKDKLRSTTNIKTPLVSKDQPQHCPISSCFSGQPQILWNITTIKFSKVSKIKSVFSLCNARKMLQLETLRIENCDELKHIIVDIGDDNGGNNSSNVFPKLKELYVDSCEQLEYIFGHYADDDQSHSEIHLNLPDLKSVQLDNLPNLVAMCPKQYHTTFPSLVKLELNNCILVGSKSIGDFMSPASSTSLDSTTMKCFSGQPQILWNITTIKLSKVSKIKSVFTLSAAPRMLVETLRIDNCDELKHIIVDIGDDKGGNNSSNVFPKLKELYVECCEQLEYIFGHYAGDDQSHNEIHLHLPELENLHLNSLPSFVAMSPKQHHTTFPSLVKLELFHCTQVQIVICLEDKISVFPKLKELEVCSCKQSEYIFGHYADDDQSHNEIHLNLPDLKSVKLFNLPNLVAICPKQYHTTFPSLVELELENCTLVASKCIGDFMSPASSTSLDSTTMKCFSGQPQILCNITTIHLSDVSKIKSVFILSITPTMLQLETLIIGNCDELKHIIVVDIGDDNEGNNSSNVVFPRLKDLNVYNCGKLEYIFGHYADDDQSDNEIHLHLPELKILKLGDLPSLVAMSPKQYHTTFPPLVKLVLNNCIHQVASKSIGDFISHASSKDLSGADVEHLLALEELIVYNSKVGTVFFLDETNGQQLNLMLQNIRLRDLHVMTYLFVGPKSSVTLQNLTEIEIKRCEKLEIMFSTTVVRSLPQLIYLSIEQCKDLKHIIEDDAEDEMVLPPGTCFPKLERLVVVNCNKLEFVFPVTICKELHKLKVLMITEADALREIFRSKDGEKVEIPNLKVMVFVNLPSLCEAQTIQFQNVEHRVVENCQKLSLTSVSTLSTQEIVNLDFGLYWYLRGRGLLLQEDSKAQDIRNENQSAETTEDFATGIEVQATSGHELNSSQELLNKDFSVGVELTSLKSFKTSVEEGTTLVNADIVTSSMSSSSGPLVTSEQKTSSHEDGYGNISIPSLSTSQTNDQRVKDGNPSAETSKDFSVGVKVQAALGHELTSSQCLEETKEHSIQEDSTSGKDITTDLSTNSETRSKPPTQLSFPKSNQESFKTSVETLDNAKAVTSSTHLESVTSEHKTSSQQDGDGQISFPNVNAKPSATNDFDVEDSQKTSESYASVTEDIDQLIEEDPLVALEKLLTGKVSISSKPQKSVSQSVTDVHSSSVGTLLQDLKTLLNSSDLNHLISQEESKSKLISLFQQLNQHQGLLSSDINDYVEKVQNFFNDHFVKHFTAQQVFNKHNQLLDSKTDLTNKLWSAKSTQTHIDNAASTAKTRMHELTLQIDDLKKQLAELENERGDLESVVNKCDVQKKKLKAECTLWVQQSIELLSALASSEVDVREAERVRNLAEEGFANLKSLFPTV